MFWSGQLIGHNEREASAPTHPIPSVSAPLVGASTSWPEPLGLSSGRDAADIECMTAPRNCSRCGAPLPFDVRWCGQCYAPVRELTPRAPVHRGNFVDVPHHAGRNVPHWSRWEASATTFGPVGRAGWTVAVVGLGLNTVMQNPLMVLFLVPTVLALIHALWRPGWVVPDEPVPRGIRRFRPEGRVKDWLFDVDELATTAIATVVALGVGAAVIYGDPILQFCAIVAGVVVVAYLFFRRFFDRA